MQPNEIRRTPYTIIFEIIGGDCHFKAAWLPDDPSTWSETDVLDQIAEEGEDRDDIAVLAVLSGHSGNHWGCALPF